MLFVQFHVGTDRYVLAGSHVVDVIPAVVWQAVPDAPRGVAGLFNYHGTPVPLVDLSTLMSGTPSAVRMNTRILVVDPGPGGAVGAGGDTKFGVLVERVVGTLRRPESDFVDPGTLAAGASYAGPVLADDEGVIQRITVEQLLPAGVREQLLRHHAERA